MAGNWDPNFFAAMDEHGPIDEALFVVPEEDEEEEEDDDEEDEEEEEEDDEEEDDDEEDEERENGDDDDEVMEIPHPLAPDSNPSCSRVSERDSEVVDSQGTSSNFNRDDVEGLFCPICMEPWSNSGEHQPSCLACGHLFGMSCIKKWLGQRRNSGKCPQCNKKCTLKDVRRIYGSQVVVVDEESQKRIRYLEAKCESLGKKDEELRRKEIEWHNKESSWQKKEADLCQKLQQLAERTKILELTLGNLESKSLSSCAAADRFERRSATECKVGINSSSASSYGFTFQQELLVDGARFFDVDDSGQVLIIARRPTRIGGSHMLTKMSLYSPHEQDDMHLPPSIKAIRDLHVSPFGRLALLASMGKKLCVVSTESNNIVLNYDLPAAAWSCSWDINSSHYAHAGLQNGMLLVFDLRQTARPLELRNGLTYNPVHTICSVLDDSAVHSGVKQLLTASSVGLCQWNIGGANEQPSLIPETKNQGVCISLACCPSSGNIVATFRPRVEMTGEYDSSQLSQATSTTAPHVQGSHVLINRVGSSYQKLGSTKAYVPAIRLPRSTIFGATDDNSVLVSGDEATCNLVVQELPSLAVTQRLHSNYPIHDVKYTAAQKPGLLCCLSGDRVQFYSRKSL